MRLAAKLEAKVLPVHTPAGEGARHLFNILLGIATALRGFAQREQLHYLARKILIRRFAAAVGTIQVNQHSRVFGDAMQQGRKAAQGMAAK